MRTRSSASDRGLWAGTDDETARRRYRALVDVIDEGIFRLDTDEHIVAVNDAFVETTGYERDELHGEHVSFLLTSDDVERLDSEIHRQRDSREPTQLELSVRTASGETIACQVRVDRVETEGEFRGTICVVTRVAETRTSSDESVQTPSDVFATIIEETEGAALILDDSFEIAWADPSIGEYFGVDASELVGRDKRAVVHELLKGAVEDSDRFAGRVLATYDDNTYVEKFECHVTEGEDREERWLEHWSKPITCGQYAGGRIECYTDVSDRKHSAEVRKETEAQFDSLVDAVTEYAIFRLDPDGTITSWNEGATEIKGYDGQEILGEHISTFYTERDRAADVPQRNLERAAEAGSAEDEGWRVRKDGSRFWANVTISAIRDDQGTLQGFLKVTRDMTERHRYQQGLENELFHILDRVSDAFFGLDEDFQFTYVNERAAELIEVPPKEAHGEVIWDLFPGAVDTPFEAEYRRAMREQESVSFEEFFPPLAAWFEVSAYPSETGLSVYFRDVTERREREQALRDREQELMEYKKYTDDVLNAIDDLFYVVDREGRYQRWNETFCTITGYSDDEIEEMNALDLVVEADRQEVANSIKHVFDGGNARIETTILTKSGQQVPMEIVAAPVETPDGEPVVAGIGRDITQRKRRQQQLEASNERLEQFAHAASHDLQEPLRMVSSYLQLIERRYGDVLDEEGQEFLEFAVDGADRMRDMIDGLLAYSRIESKGAPFEPVELNGVLDDVCENLQVKLEEHDADVNVATLPRVEGDSGQLHQLFQNLLDNAITYSGDAPPEIHVSAERDGGMWVLSVRDEGVGIDPDDADRIFEVFQSLDPDSKGSGIGLALCKRIVERHGGDMWVDSSPGEGATFSFTLPAAGDDGE